MLNESVIYILRNILQLAFENGAEFVEGLGLHVIVCTEPSDGFAVDAAFFAELICGNAIFRHGFPELIKYNHITTSILDTNYYGGYNLDY